MKYLRLGSLLHYIFLDLTIGVIGCAKSLNPDIERDSDYHFKDDHPEVRFSAIRLIDDKGGPHINISEDIVYGSLIYNQEDNNYVSNLAIEIQIIDRENSDRVVNSERYTLEKRIQTSYIAKIHIHFRDQFLQRREITRLNFL